jgi:hypothetical protein
MVRSTPVSGKKTRERGMAFVRIPMDPDTKESGSMTKEKEKDS